MARCNCSSSRCACSIVAGTGATVGGTGRADDPYVISATGGGGGAFDSGDVKWTARSSPPAGWLIADGAPVSRSTYADLFAAIGTAYGNGDGSTTFNLPDLTGKFAIGADGTYPRGSQGGTAQNTLTTAQVPVHKHPMEHTHTGTANLAGAHDHDLRKTPGNGSNTSTLSMGTTSNEQQGSAGILNNGAHTHSVTIPVTPGQETGNNTGGGQPVNNLPPYTAMLPLIKT